MLPLLFILIHKGRGVCRIKDVRFLRQTQFAEDAGTMSHPIRPNSYQEINNFYTVTVYEKGAEVVRMLQTLVGGQLCFRKGMDLYISRHDGSAVTCDDFVAAMADANNKDFEQFKLWYSQVGTPRVKINEHYDSLTETYSIQLTQTFPSIGGVADNTLPLHIPLLYKCLVNSEKEQLFELKTATATLVLPGFKEKPVLSINRNFSAPVIIDFMQTTQDLLHMLELDDDPFNRWDAAQKLYTNHILRRPNEPLDSKLVSLLQKILEDRSVDPAYKELLFTIPSETYLYEFIGKFWGKN